MLTPELYTWYCQCEYLYGEMTQSRFGEGTQGYPSDEDVERYLELTVLAAIPVHSSESRGAKGAKEQPVNDNGKRKSRKKNQ